MVEFCILGDASWEATEVPPVEESKRMCEDPESVMGETWYQKKKIWCSQSPDYSSSSCYWDASFHEVLPKRTACQHCALMSPIYVPNKPLPHKLQAFYYSSEEHVVQKE